MLTIYISLKMIFLSASVPQPDREFFGTENVYAIKEAVISFVRVCAEKRLPFYFGGHPAITPLVWNVAKNYSGDKVPAIKIYQSRYFGDQIPQEVEHFNDVHMTEAVDGDVRKSVNHMRHARGTADRDERCDTYLDIHDIEKDAERIKTRRFMLKKLREIEEKEVVA